MFSILIFNGFKKGAKVTKIFPFRFSDPGFTKVKIELDNIYKALERTMFCRHDFAIFQE